MSPALPGPSLRLAGPSPQRVGLWIITWVVVMFMVPFWGVHIEGDIDIYRCRYRYRFIIWVVVNFMAPFRVLNIVGHLVFRGPKRGTTVWWEIHASFHSFFCWGQRMSYPNFLASTAVGNGGMSYRDCHLEYVRTRVYCRDPFPHSLLITSLTKVEGMYPGPLLRFLIWAFSAF